QDALRWHPRVLNYLRNDKQYSGLLLFFYILALFLYISPLLWDIWGGTCIQREDGVD
ncbi:unnamed protein product, partial [marine sediment metagenome]